MQGAFLPSILQLNPSSSPFAKAKVLFLITVNGSLKSLKLFKATVKSSL